MSDETTGTIPEAIPDVPARDNVNHPSHYTFGCIEVIDALEAWELEFHEANVVKYVARAKHKANRLEDLRKARWYLDRKIQLLENEAAKAASSVTTTHIHFCNVHNAPMYFVDGSWRCLYCSSVIMGQQ